jgi:hypothetical protein
MWWTCWLSGAGVAAAHQIPVGTTAAEAEGVPVVSFLNRILPFPPVIIQLKSALAVPDGHHLAKLETTVMIAPLARWWQMVAVGAVRATIVARMAGMVAVVAARGMTEGPEVLRHKPLVVLGTMVETTQQYLAI